MTSRWYLAAITCSVGQALVYAQPAVNQGAVVQADFSRRVADYVKLHNSARSEIHALKPTKSASKIKEYEHHLAARIRELRRDASQGAIFTPAITAEFRRLVGITMQGPNAVRIRESLARAAPVRLNALRVNGQYPEEIPLQSTPPSLLLNLPALPPEVEFRLVSRALVLRDTDANLIADFIPNLLP